MKTAVIAAITLTLSVGAAFAQGNPPPAKALAPGQIQKNTTKSAKDAAPGHQSGPAKLAAPGQANKKAKSKN